jgi:LPS-assembly protein
MKQVGLVLVLCLLVATSLPGRADEEPAWNIQATSKSDVSWSGEEVTWVNGASLTVHETTLTSERGVANTRTGEVHAMGRVTILGHNHIWEGTNVFYNFKTAHMETGEFKTSINPFFIAGTGLGTLESNKVYSARNSYVTTDDYSEPLYEIRAQLLFIVPDKYVEAYNATLWLGSVPVMYLPHYKRALGRHLNNYVMDPGYQSVYGAYMLNTYNWYANSNLDGSVRFDYRTRRGFAGGPGLNLHLGPTFGDGKFNYYYARDEDANVDAINGLLPKDRKFYDYSHFAEPTTNTVAKLVAHYQSDPQVMRDFFESQYRTNVQPSSYLEVTHLWPNFTFDALAQPQIVDFYETVERLPDLKLSGARQEVGATPIFYESESSFGYFRRRFSSTNDTGVSDYSAARGDSYHQLILPQTYFGWLNVAPRVGGRVTYYSATQDTLVATNDQVRGVFNTGSEFTAKASRTWRGVESDTFDANGLRHIIEPGLNYVYVPRPNRTPNQLPQFDSESPSLRLLPIDYPDYNSIDSIDSENVVRLSVRNLLQTKRHEQVDNLANWALYTDWRLDPRANQGRFADVFSDMELKPRSWLTLGSQLRYDVDQEKWREAYHTLQIRPNNTWAFSLSHRYWMNNDPMFITYPGEVIPGNDTFMGSLFYRMNENWAARISQRYEARDGKLEEQYYTIYRDLRSWTSALTLRWRENRAGRREDFTVAVTFSLKAFPRYGLGKDLNVPYNFNTGF